ncbi:hypothetical protein BU26DRAFT_516286 [Trematosphaeria pertusa]|uniref:Uncharacterized protein n=1 Tax=Trematosphaeria pertusa TaxID=390896 RepID=A0A6A6IWP3_9PLEO|nr:uncharacterized protein BU26DRAFT_516286 [Trematosphaeria pertusa]KAF2254040.1 hypothetical protein BU26DRAFT_516286 [Trematosphaeria pertusa]
MLGAVFSRQATHAGPMATQLPGRAEIANVSRRQQSSFEAHVLHMRGPCNISLQDHGRARKPGGGSLQLAITRQLLGELVRVRAEPTSNDATALESSRSPTPQSPRENSDSEHASDTDQTSNCGSDCESHDAEAELRKALVAEKEETASLRVLVERVEGQLLQEAGRYSDLLAKKDDLVACRIGDYEKLQAAAEANRNLCAEYDALNDALTEEVAHWKAKFERVTATVDEISSLSLQGDAVVQIKDEHIVQLKMLLANKDQEVAQAKKDAAQEKRDFAKVAAANRQAWKTEKESLEGQLEQLKADYQDALFANEHQIEKLTARNLALEKEHVMIADVLVHEREPKAKRVQEVVEANEPLRKELKHLKRKLKVSRENEENILDKMEQMSGQVTEHLKKEEKARRAARHLEYKNVELEEKLARKEEQMQKMTQQIVAGTRSTTIKGDRANSALNDGASILEDTLLKNEELHALLDAEREEKEGMRLKLCKLDDQNVQQSWDLEMMQSTLSEQKEKAQKLRKANKKAEKEIGLLRAAVERSNGLTEQDKQKLTFLVKHTVDKNKKLEDRNSLLAKQLESAKVYIQTVEDKADSEVRKWEKRHDCWYSLYYDEAVPKNERLENRIHELMREKGEDYWQESEHPENRTVSDRNALRIACAETLTGVDEDLIPPEAFDPAFSGGYLPATYQALKKLRPKGWIVISELGRAWLTPKYKPFTEEDAEERIQAREQKERLEHRAAMGFPAPEKVEGKPYSHVALTSQLTATEDVNSGPEDFASDEPVSTGASTPIPADATPNSGHGSGVGVPPEWDPSDANTIKKEDYDGLDTENKWDYHRIILGKDIEMNVGRGTRTPMAHARRH